MKYIIHLKIQNYEPQKKDKKNDVDTAQKGLEDSCKKTFKMAVGQSFKDKELVILKEEYSGPIFINNVVVMVDIKEDKVDQVLTTLRTMDFIDTIEREIV